ncbi:DUF2891 domain-containing protein [Croceibacterium sp. TMG7-5b_MA50]|uniref:DUF2891 domain-containing protein n=1 Tax=Croceibacterium sp. TMG7-5b_MA50 TaxID=3121290 RepID=UPI003221BFA2
MTLTPDIAARFAPIALGHVAREYPHKLDHVLVADADALPPRVLHPVFFGSFDWHSCVHGWWTLLTLRRLFPDMAPADEIDTLAAGTFTAEKLAVELAYLDRPSARGFERPYGWAWLLALHHAAERLSPDLLGPALEPLARRFAGMLGDYLQVLTYPITTGTHFNTAFALVLAREWAVGRDPALLAAIDRYAMDGYAGRSDYQGWEPGGDEFLSPALTAALLLARVMPAGEFARWFDAFLPAGRIAGRLTPAIVSDRSDGKIAHLDGLNLSRAWCLNGIAAATPDRAAELRAVAETHLAAGLDHVAGDYMGEHWLASFALLALLARG